MENKRTKIIAASVVALIVITAICVWLSDPLRPKNALKISLVCTTNDSSLGLVAIFCISNRIDTDINMMPWLPQIKNHGDWQMFQMWSNTFDVLPSHEAIIIGVPISTNCEAWRFPVSWYHPDFKKNDLLRTWLIGNVSQNWWSFIHGKHFHYYNRIQVDNTAFSETITNK